MSMRNMRNYTNICCWQASPDFDLEDFYNRHLSYFKGFFSSVFKKYPEYFITC